MFELISLVLIGIIGMMLGIKAGIEYLARDLQEQGRLSPEECKYIISNEYFWKSFRLFDDD